MAHTLTDKLSPTERNFMEIMQRADDFYKIELLRHAKSLYKKALDFNLETARINQKIIDCDKKIASEQKITYILLAIAVIAISSYMLL